MVNETSTKLLFFVDEYFYEINLLRQIEESDVVEQLYNDYNDIIKPEVVSIPNMRETLSITEKYVKSNKKLPEYFTSHILSQISLMMLYCKQCEVIENPKRLDEHNIANFRLLLLRSVVYYIIHHINHSNPLNSNVFNKSIKIVQKLDYLYIHSSHLIQVKKEVLRKYNNKVKLLISDLNFEENKRIDKNYLSSLQRKIVFSENKL